jgi:hypothetical protein
VTTRCFRCGTAGGIALPKPARITRVDVELVRPQFASNTISECGHDGDGMAPKFGAFMSDKFASIRAIRGRIDWDQVVFRCDKGSSIDVKPKVKRLPFGSDTFSECDNDGAGTAPKMAHSLAMIGSRDSRHSRENRLEFGHSADLPSAR